jgi:septum formation topological specificity factor MinE
MNIIVETLREKENVLESCIKKTKEEIIKIVNKHTYILGKDLPKIEMQMEMINRWAVEIMEIQEHLASFEFCPEEYLPSTDSMPNLPQEVTL